MNKIFKIIWNATTQTWVVVSELTRAHTKRASATVATAVLATLLSATVQASNGESEDDPPDTNFDPNNPTFDDEFKVGEDIPAYKFGLVVVGKNGEVKTDYGSTDTEAGKNNISVEESESSDARPNNKTSYLYLRENGGITIDQEGRSAKFSVNTGDGLKIDGDKVAADTGTLTITDGKITAPEEGDKKKLVNVGGLESALNSLGWRLKATNGSTQTVKSGDEVEFKGEGVTVKTENKDGKHIVTITAAQTQPPAGGNAGGAWKATAAAADGGTLDGEAKDQEVKAGDKVTFKAGKNLKVKQEGANFTYSLKETLTGLTSITLGKDNETKTVINKDGLTITPVANGATDTANAISVTTSGIKAGNKEITNVASALKTYKDAQNGAGTQPAANTVEAAKQDLVDLTKPVAGAAGNGADAKAPDTTAATVGDLRGLGWVLSAKKTTNDNGAADTEFHQAVKNATEVEFVGKNGATVSAKTDNSGKHIVTVDVAEITANGGLKKDGNTISLNTTKDANNLLTVKDDGSVEVAKGSFADVKTDATTGQGQADPNRGKVVVKASDTTANATPTEADKKKVATVGDVADAINSASTFVKVQNTTDELDDNQATDKGDDALKAGDTLTLKAGKNLKVKRSGKEVTFALAKDITTENATFSNKLSIGGATTAGTTTPKVDITSTADGLKFAKEPAGANGDTKVHLTNIASTLDDHRVGGNTTHLDKEVNEAHRNRAATVGDVLNSGWNIRGVKPMSTSNQVESVDFVATYDTVDFISDGETTTVTVAQKDNKKGAEVKIGAKTSVIKTKDGKLVTGKEGAVTGTPNDTEDADEGKGLVTAKTVIEAVNKAGWRIKTTANGQAGQGNFETVTSGTNVTFADGNATTAIVSKDNKGNITVKYDVNVGDGLKLSDDGTKITADTTALTVAGGKVTAPTADAEKKKLVNAENLATALNDLSWTATAGKDGTGELDGKATDQEVKAGDKVTFKAGDNLKVKQDGANFTYSLKDALTGLTSVTLGKDNDVKTVIDKNGLTITPANAGADNANTISVTKDGIKAGNKEITNVKSGLTTYGNNQNGTPTTGSVDEAKKDLVDLTKPAADAATNGADAKAPDNTAATVGDLRGLGWVLSSDKTTKADGNGVDNTEFHKAVKNATEVEFVGKNGATVSAKTDTQTGKHTVTVDVAEITANSGLKKDGNVISLKTKAGDDNLLTVEAGDTGGAVVTKGSFGDVKTDATDTNRGKVTVTGVADLTKATAEDKKKVATVVDVAKAINDAATFVKAENTDDEINDKPVDDGTKDALKAGDTLTLKAGKNLRVKRDGSNVTFALAKDLEVTSAKVSNKLSIGSGTNAVDVTSDAQGLHFAKSAAVNGDKSVYLNGIASTLHDTLTGAAVTKVEKPAKTITDEEKHRAASVQDVFNAGWNIKGFKPGETSSSNVDFVRTYDTVEFLSENPETTTVTVESKDGGVRTEVKIGAKTSVIKEKDGKLVTGKNGAVTGTPNATEDTDEGNGLVTANTVIEAVNKAGWRIKTTTGANNQAGQFETVTSGTNVTFDNGNATTAIVSKDNKGNITVKYDVNVGDGLKLDDNKIAADTVTLTVNSTDGDAANPKGKVANVAENDKKKLVKADDLVTALNSLSWTATAAADGGELENNGATNQEVKAGDKVTFKAGKNLKVKQEGANFTYSLKDALTGLTSITLGDTANGGNGGTTVINKDGLTITPANAGANNANTISVTTSGISAGSKEITNVASALKTYGANNGVAQPAGNNTVDKAKEDLVNLDTPVTPAAGVMNGAGTDTKVPNSTAATVGDLRGLGWVLSAEKTTDETQDKEFHAAVKNATEVEFVGKNGATVSAKTDTATGKHTVTVDVAKTKVGDGLKDDNGTIKLNTTNSANNLLTVKNDGSVEVAKGAFDEVKTEATAAGQGATANADRGKVVVKASDTALNATPTEADKKKVATVGDVADAINSASTFVKVENDDTATADDVPADNGKDDALKAGDTLTLKAGKNLKVKRDGANVTFALAKDLDVKTAKVSDTLTIGGGATGTETPKVDITSTSHGLNFAKNGVMGDDANVHLTGIASTLQDTLSNTGVITNLDGKGIDDDQKKRAASIKDVLSAGWNIRGVKPTSTNNKVENIDFVATYDTVDFVSKDDNTTSVTVESQDNGKRTEVKIGAKTSVIKEKDGKLFTGKDNKEKNNVDSATTTDNTDDGKGLVTAKTVIEAVNKAGWRIKTTANGQAGQGNFETVTSGTNVTFADGKGTTAEVAKADDGSITVKYNANVGDGLKLSDGSKKIVADTVTLTVNSGNEADKPKGKVADITKDEDKKKLVKAGDLVTALNSLSWTATAAAGDDGKLDGTASKQEVKAGETVTFKAGKNLKVKQEGANFTYSLQDALTGLTSITLGDTANGGNGATTKITNEGLTITPAAGAGANNANTISVTTSGIKAGNKEITNVASALKTYKDAQNGGTQPTAGSVEEAKQNLVKLDDVTNTAAGGTATTDNGLKNKAATVGDLAGLGWVLSADKTTKDDNSGVNDTAFHAAVKNANEVEFKGKGAATVSAKSENGGKYVVTVDVAKTKVADGLKEENDGTIKVKAKEGADNLLTVTADGASVTKGEFNKVETTTPTTQGGNTNTADRGKVTVKASNGGQATADDKKKVATVGDVADAINSASTFVKVQSTNDDIEDSAASENETTGEALKAGDTLTLKAGKNLKVKRDGSNVTFALAKDLEVTSAKVSNKLSIGSGTNAVDVTSDAQGLHFAKSAAVNGDKSVYLNGIASTLHDTLTGAAATKVEKPAKTITDEEKHRAASVQDVFNAGWNIKGFKPGETSSSNVDFVRTYDTVEFLSENPETTTVTVESKDGGVRTEVKIGAKTSVIKEKDGKLVTGKNLKATDNTATISEEDAKDEGKGLVTANEVIEAVNKAGWRVKTTGTPAAGKDGFETVTSGTNVTFDNGNGTTAEVTKDAQGGITVKYNASVSDGLKLENNKIVADTVTLAVNNGNEADKPKGKVADITSEDDKKKLVNAGGLVEALNKLSWTATAGKDGTGELDGKATDQEVKAGDKVTFKAGDNLKVKQDGANFTYSLKDSLTGLKDITLNKTSDDSAAGATTKITSDGLTITPAAGAGAIGTNTANTISVTKDGIKAGGKEITNVKSALTTYGATSNGAGTQPQPAVGSVEAAKSDLVNLTNAANTAGGTTANNGLANKAATVGDLAGLGWVLSAKKTTSDNGATDTEFHAAVKNANEVEFVGTGSATVSAKTTDGKHIVTVNVKEAELGDGLEKENGKIKLKVDSTNTDNVLTVDPTKGVSVTKGSFDEVKTEATATAQGATPDANRGKVVVSGVTNGGQPSEADKKKVATVVDVAKAINDAATFVKVGSTTDDIEDDAVNGDDTKDQALKAGDTLTLKAGKNLKVKREGKDVTFALAKDLDVKTAKVSDTLTIGGNIDAGGTATPKVNVTSTGHGLNFAKEDATGDDANVYLNGIASTLTDTLLNGGAATNLDGKGIKDDEKKRAASVKDVLNAGWNVRGVKPTSTDNTVENIDFVATYDTVEFVSKDNDTTSVTVENKENGKKTEVKIGAKTSVIKEKDGKLFTGQGNKNAGGTNTNATEDADTGTGLVTAKTVIEAVNKAGWRIKTTATPQNGDGFETVTSGTNVTFASGNGTTAIVTKDTNGITVKYDAKLGDGLKIGDDQKITVDTTALTVTDGKVATPNNGDGKKLVNAGGLADALNKLSWTATAGKDANGELDGEAKDQEVKAGDKVTFKAGDNLKVKQEGANFTYSLKDALTGLTSVTLGKDNDVKTVIDKNGLTITPAANGATDTASTISVTKDGIKAGNKAIDNVASALKTYGQANAQAQPQPQVQTGSVEEAKKDLVDLTKPAAGGATNGADAKAPDNTAATVGDLRGLGWVLSSDKTTDDTSKPFHAAVKNAAEVEFVGTGSATVSAKTDNGKHVVTVNVKETELGDGLEKDNDGKIKVKASKDANNLLTVTADGASVTKGEFNTVDTTTPAAQGGNTNAADRGKVTVKASDTTANATPTEDDKKKVATVGDVADAINSASTFVKVQSTNDDIEDSAASDNETKDQALKAGDTLTLKAGKNLKAKLDGKSVTFALAKDLEVTSAKVSNKLSIGTGANAVDVTSDAKGLHFAKGTTGTNNDTTVHLNGIASTLTDTLLNGGTTKTVTKDNVTSEEKQRAASVQDVLNAGWNIRGVKSASTNNQVEDVDFVATYDKVEFLSSSKDTTTVTVDSEGNGKTTKVQIGAKTSVIKEKDGKLFTGKENKEQNQVTSANEADNTDEGKGLVTAKTVIEAVNKAGWRIKTTDANGQDGEFATVASGTNVTFADGKGTTASVTKGTDGAISVTYNAKVGDGLKIGDDQKITADTTALTVEGGKVTAPDATKDDAKKLVNAGSLAEALNKLSWTATAGKDGTGEVEPATPADQEVKAGDKVTFKAGDNLKVKQSGKDFTYSLKDSLTGLKDITLNKASDGSTNSVTTKITSDGLTITPAANGATDTANTISVTTSGIKAGNKEITNVKSGLNAYGDKNNPTFNAAGNSATDLTRQVDGAYDGLLNLNEKGADKNLLVSDSTAATVGDLRKLGWVVSTKKGADEKSHQVKQADEVLFTGSGAATVTSASENGKHTITVSVAETKADSGLEKDGDTIKLKVDKSTNNVLTVSGSGTAVTKGEFNTVDTAVPAENASDDTKANRGKVTVKDADKADKSVATVKDVATAINSAATFVKTENLTTALDEADAKDEGEDALKAGDTLTFKAGKNLKVKRKDKDITFDLAKDLEAKTATFSDRLTIGGGSTGTETPKVNVTSTAGGLNFENAVADASGSKNVQLNGVKSGLSTFGDENHTLDPSNSLDDFNKHSDALNSYKGLVNLNEKGANGQPLVSDSTVATVGDLRGLGWVLSATDGKNETTTQVKQADEVKFKGEGLATVSISEKENSSEKIVTVSVKTGEVLKDNEFRAPDGTKLVKIGDEYFREEDIDPATGKPKETNGKKVTAKYKTVNNKVLAVGTDGSTSGDAVTLTNQNQGVVTGKQVAEAIAKSGWNLGLANADQAVSAFTTGGKALSADTLERVNANDNVRFANGKNTVVKAAVVEDVDKEGNKVTNTYVRTDVTGLPVQYTTADGKAVSKVGDKYYTLDNNGEPSATPLTDEQVGKLSVNLVSPTAGNNPNEGNKPTALGNLANGAKTFDLPNTAKAADGTELALANDGKYYPKNKVGADNAAPTDNTTSVKVANPGNAGLADLANSKSSNAATVGDLKNLGWQISAGDGYNDQVRNADKVNFKGSNGISVSGKTLDDGTREITFELAKGEVVKSNEFTVKNADGTETNLVKVGDKYYRKEDIDLTTGKPKVTDGNTVAAKYQDKNGKIVSVADNNTEATLTNKGSGYVTGNQVADAIAKSGFELGLANEADEKAAFGDETKALTADKLETVNANDKVRFANGLNTKVSAATVESTDANGDKVTTTFVKTDVELPLTQIYNTDANGKKIVKNGDKWYYTKDDGSADTDKEVTLGNVDANGKKVVKVTENGADKWYYTNADGAVDKTKGEVSSDKVSTDEKHVVSLDPNDQSKGKGVVINNVANGDISPNSKQAVNGSQIFALTGNKAPNITNVTVENKVDGTTKVYNNVVVGEDGKTPLLTTYNVEGRKEVITNSVVEAIYNMNEQGIKFFHSNDGTAKRREERSNDFDSSASGKYATAIGARADAAGNNAIAFGYESKALRDNTVAIGTGNVVNAEKSGAFGDPNYIEDGANGSYAFGNDNRITSKNTFVLGNSVNAKRDADGNVLTEEKEVVGKDGTKTKVTVPQALGETVENSVYLGNASTATKDKGKNLKSDGTAGNTTTAGATGTVEGFAGATGTVEGFAGATARGAVSVGASGEERRIQNVAAGEISATSTDAINGSQLYAVAKGVTNLAGQVNKVGKRADAGTASALAASQLPQATMPGKSMVAIAGSSYQGQNGLAIGVSRISDNGKVIIRLSGTTNSQGKTGVAAGVGYQW
ncbi:Hia/Hsf adhesin N-terminal domain-containing protein [Haemophilus influenzae]|uniref:Hia/Hsf adhesin N-terminal domain-containing protein n=1 Tax=Haemophilus influenzae TaxID=727 RepID=UPI003DA1EAEC